MEFARSVTAVLAAVPLTALFVSPTSRFSAPNSVQSAIWLDTLPDAGLSALQRRAVHRSKWGPTEQELASLELNLTDHAPGACEDRSPHCAELAARWANCMDNDLTQRPPPPPRALEPVEFLRQNCRKTCAYCGNEAPLQQYFLRRIKNDEVDVELSYAKNGSQMPESLHGIWWMDQWGSHPEGTKCDPSFHYNFWSFAVDEMLLTWGDGFEWDPVTKCVAHNPYGGRQGHWTYTNQGEGYNRIWAMINYPSRLNGAFCFKSDDFVDILMWVLPTEPAETFFYRLIWGPPNSQGFFKMPSYQQNYQMKRTCFGWHRITTAVLPPWVAERLGLVLNYPIFQIVDGNGRRTEHWDAYLRWANTKNSYCEEGPGPCSVGDGTSMTPQWVGPNARQTAPSPLPYPLAWLQKFSQ